jgi:hypothetical protein
MSERKFRKKIAVVEAVQWSGSNWHQVYDFAGHEVFTTSGNLFVKTPDGTLGASPGDWIVKGVKGNFYPCPNDIFQEIWEEVDDEDE